MPSSTPPQPRPDGRRVRGDRTRQAVLAQSVHITAVEGLESLTFGRVAQAAGVPKSTLQALFKDRETLQIHTLVSAADAFAAGIRERLPPKGGAFVRLKGLCEAWFDLVAEGALPGGCLVTATMAEYRARPGPILALAAEHRDRWRTALREAAQAAQLDGALRADQDVEQLVFEILAFQAVANLKAGQAGATELRRARLGVEALLSRARPDPAPVSPGRPASTRHRAARPR